MDKQDYTRLARADSKIICCKQTSTCTQKTALTYLHPSFLSFSILLRLILCRITVAGAVKVRQKLTIHSMREEPNTV